MTESKGLHSGFVEFYDSQKIMPVRQDLNDPTFKNRRMYLYRTLGVPLEFLGGKKILEFGPGGGFNAHALTSFGPVAEYFCVEGSKVGKDLITKHFFDGNIFTDNFEVHHCDFLDFRTTKKFDVVIAEACIPGQVNPAVTLAHIGRFVNDSGYLIITCTSKSSQLSEILRSVYSLVLEFEIHDLYEHKKFIFLEFEKHLATLKTITRNVEDWVNDNIFQKWHTRKADFNLIEAMHALPNFEFLHSNPQFLTDLNWYKTYSLKNKTRNNLMISQYEKLDLLMLDNRISFEQLSHVHLEKTKTMSQLIERCYEIAKEVLVSGVTKEGITDLASSLFELSRNCESHGFQTHKALNELVEFFYSKQKTEFVLSEAREWWGRGQMYASFYRG